MKKVVAHMVCHTHWDREWYLTREVFRTKLVRLIDKLLDIVETTPDYVSFMLDGQTIVLEDYLAIRPENSERLKSALNKGKILCGPWYILPDELLISGETHIRNYLMGLKVSLIYGGHMNIAYLPDSFGHPEQMPQIVTGLGMDTMIFWRGTSNAMTKTEFLWKSPYSSSQVLCIHMPAGYGNSARLIPGESSKSRLEKMISTLHERSHTDIVLLMNGTDHLSAQEDIVDIVKAFNQNTQQNFTVKLSTMADYLEDVKKELPGLETFTGEFRYGDRSMLLGGTLSTRMPLKQRNHLVQKRMERYLEPIKALQQLMGMDTRFDGYSTYIWKKILENHPHDSICGCSIDEVHREMLTRFDCVDQLQEELIDRSMKELEMQAEANGEADAQLILFEPVQDRLQDYVEVEVDLDPMMVQEVDFSISKIVDYEDQIQHPDLPAGLVFKDQYGREIQHVILSAEKTYYTYLQDETAPEVYKVNRVKAGLLLPDYDYGVHLINVYKTDKEEQKQAAKECPANASNDYIENEYYRISFNEAMGALDVLDKKTGQLHTGVHRLVDKGDTGDEYTYSWPLNDSVYGLKGEKASIRYMHKGDICSEMIIRGCLELPCQLSGDRKSRSREVISSEIEIRVKLFKGVDRIDFHTVFNNRAKDHRLQVEFPSGVLVKQSSASGAFGITKREIDLVIPEQWMEYPQSTHPNHGFVDTSSEEYGLSLAALGLTEFEAENIDSQTFVRLTLLRCVGWLSRTDLLTRKGNGGWTIETPDAQCLGRHEFEYSIMYHEGDWRKENTYGRCDRKIHGVYVQQLRDSQGKALSIENPLGFLSQLPAQVRLSAVKPAENGKGIIIRLFSIAEELVSASLSLPKQVLEVYEANLKEDRIKRQDISSGMLNITLEPSQIITYELEC